MQAGWRELFWGGWGRGVGRGMDVGAGQTEDGILAFLLMSSEALTSYPSSLSFSIFYKVRGTGFSS